MKGYASIGYLDNEGTVKGQSYTRYTTKLSLDLKPTKWFNLGLNVNGTFSEQQYGSSASSVGQLIKGMPSNLYAASTSLFPYASPYDEDGNRIEYPGGDDKVKNVMNEWNNSQNERRMFRAIGSLYAQLDLGEIYAPLKGLRYRLISDRISVIIETVHSVMKSQLAVKVRIALPCLTSLTFPGRWIT